MLWAGRTTTVMIRVPVATGNPDRLELEYPWVVLIIEILVGDQLNITAGLGTDQRRT
jgi:hypothetical protein